MQQFTQDQIEFLFNYFQPKSEIVTNKLPNVKEVRDGVLVTLVTGNVRKLYKMEEGSWKLIGTLS